MNPTNGKGSGRYHARTKISPEQMQSNWDKAFGKKTDLEKKDKTDSDPKNKSGTFLGTNNLMSTESV